MSVFNMGDKVVCVCKDEDNWYEIGSEFTIRSAPFRDTQDNTICYLVKEQPNNGVYIQGSQFKLTKEEPKQMKPTDKITVEITLAELAVSYMVFSKMKAGTADNLYNTAKQMLDPEATIREATFRKVPASGIIDKCNNPKDVFELMFPEPPKKSKEQIKIEELEILLMDTKNKLEELKNISK